MRVRAGFVVTALVLCLLPLKVDADEAKNKGLFISPLRKYVQVAPGGVQSGTFTVANITNHTITVDLSIEQFSVDHYSYDYQFSQTRDNWITLGKAQTTLKPNKSETIPYTVRPPAAAQPGGHYFSLFATTQFPDSPHKVRAATVLYLTVDGALAKTSAISKTTIPAISLGSSIDYSLDVTNTGNTHYFVYTTGHLEGLSARSERPENTSLLLPGKHRVVGGAIPAPFLPGVYQAVYGFKVDDGQIVERKQLLVYIPPWSLIVPAGTLWFALALRRYRRRSH